MTNNQVKQLPEVTVGLIMPISTIDSCTSDHWVEVKDIITSSLQSSSCYLFKINLVSDAEDVGVIQKRIVQNVYSSDIVVCDVSCKNPNVMFELGMRLAFDKPTIIIKDTQTGYSFDTSVIEHLEYPRDLRFHKIISFKQKLLEKTEKTYEISRTDTSSSFLSNFATIKVKSLPEKESSASDLILESIESMRSELRDIRNRDLFSNEVINDLYLSNNGRFYVNENNNEILKRIKSDIYKYVYESKSGDFNSIVDEILNTNIIMKYAQKYHLPKTLLMEMIKSAVEQLNKEKK